VRARWAIAATTAAGLTIFVANGWPVAALGCVAILSVLAFIMWIVSQPRRITAVERLLRALRDLFK
jgi:cyanate permease